LIITADPGPFILMPFSLMFVRQDVKERLVHLNITRSNMRCTLIPFLTTAFLLAISSVNARAQDSTEVLRPHIVHAANANGEEEYRDDRTPTIADTTICFIYLGRKENGPLWLRLQVRHSAYKRLDMHEIIFQKDKRKLSIKVAPALFHWGDNGMVYWEWYDTPPSNSEMKAIRAIINEPGVTLTLIGTETITRTLSETEREAMTNVLEQGRILGHSKR
jgi:hypothetical protein